MMIGVVVVFVQNVVQVDRVGHVMVRIKDRLAYLYEAHSISLYYM